MGEATAHMATEATEVPTAGTVTATHMVRVPTPDMDMDTHTAVPTLDFTEVRTLDTEVPTVGMAMDTHMLDMVDMVASMVLDMDMVATDGMGMDTHTRHLCQQTRLHLEKSESMNIIFTVCYLYDCDSEVRK